MHASRGAVGGGSSETCLWALAASGIISRYNGESFSEIASRFDRKECRSVLRDAWNVEDELDVFRTERWLEREGHSEVYRALLRDTGAGEASDPDNIAAQCRFAREHAAVTGDRDLVGWDAGRSITVARFALSAEYISMNYAQVWLAREAIRIQGSYASWAEYNQHWLLGLQFWQSGDEPASKYLESSQWLLTHDESPWSNIPWSRPLSPHRSFMGSSTPSAAGDSTALAPEGG